MYQGHEKDTDLDTNKDRNHALTKILLARHGRTFSNELDIEIHANTPSALFRLLVAAMLFSARISARLAIQAARALTDQGWVTPEKMVAASWEERTRTLNRSGYARYDERTSRMLEDTARLILDRYQGDLRNLREASGRNIDRERQQLKEFKGIGNVSVDIFLREVQVAWDELFPFVDERARQNAKELGLPTDAQSLLELVGKDDFPRLVSALIRVGLAGDHEEMLKEVRRTEKIL
jgi:endonuclease III